MKRISFKSRDGHELVGALETPVGGTKAVALFAHCFTCSAQSKAAKKISAALASLGIETMRFDFTGLGNSSGEFGASGLSGDVRDIVDAAEALSEHLEPPTFLIGHSLGGAAVLLAAHQIENVSAVATIGAPADAAHILLSLDGDIDRIEQEGGGWVQIAGRSFPISSAFIKEARETQILESVSRLRKPLLIAHGPLDNYVGVENARALFDAAYHPKTFVSLDRADHLVSEEKDADWIASILSAWASHYVCGDTCEKVAIPIQVKTDFSPS